MELCVSVCVCVYVYVKYGFLGEHNTNNVITAVVMLSFAVMIAGKTKKNCTDEITLPVQSAISVGLTWLNKG